MPICQLGIFTSLRRVTSQVVRILFSMVMTAYEYNAQRSLMAEFGDVWCTIKIST